MYIVATNYRCTAGPNKTKKEKQQITNNCHGMLLFDKHKIEI